MEVVIHKRRRDGGTRAAIAVIGGAATKYAIVRGKHKAKLCDTSAQPMRRFDEENANTGFGKVNRRAHPGDAAAEHEHRRCIRVVSGLV